MHRVADRCSHAVELADGLGNQVRMRPGWEVPAGLNAKANGVRQVGEEFLLAGLWHQGIMLGGNHQNWLSNPRQQGPQIGPGELHRPVPPSAKGNARPATERRRRQLGQIERPVPS
ncbi:hypothetical protein HRbin36_02486 [bacterium HR36]|nr:hypothetical protein HRbin36_02486 [bacterium HR36]